MGTAACRRSLLMFNVEARFLRQQTTANWAHEYVAPVLAQREAVAPLRTSSASDSALRTLASIDARTSSPGGTRLNS